MTRYSVVMFLLIPVCVAAQETRRRSAHMVNDVMAYGAVGDGVADDTAAIQEALNEQTVTCTEVYIPAGRYKITAPLTVQVCPVAIINRGIVVAGVGKGATIIESDTAGTGFEMIRSRTPSTCAGGTGSCDARIGSSGRGAGCVCYANTDCQSASCTGGTTQRNIMFRDFALLMRKDNMYGLDTGNMSSAILDNLDISADSNGYQNTVGVIGSDRNGGVSGYYNVIQNSNIHDSEVCLRLLPQSNSWTITGNKFANTCGSGVVSEVISARIIGNTFQSTQVPTCGSPCTAGTCCGSFFHGAACSVGSDCREASIILFGNNEHVDANYFEDTGNRHILLGCQTATGFGFCPNSVSNARIGWNFHSSSAQPIIHAWNTGGTRTLVQGTPAPSDAPATCDVAGTGRQYFDISLFEPCVCNGTNWCQVDGGGCTSSTSCG
jgi:hypothetical protein